MIANRILYAIALFFNVYMLMICIRCLLTWIPNLDWNNPVLNALRSSVDLYLDLFRKIIPPVGMFDFSPIVAMFALIFLERPVLWGVGYLLGIIGLAG